MINLNHVASFYAIYKWWDCFIISVSRNVFPLLYSNLWDFLTDSISFLTSFLENIGWTIYQSDIHKQTQWGRKNVKGPGDKKVLSYKSWQRWKLCQRIYQMVMKSILSLNMYCTMHIIDLLNFVHDTEFKWNVYQHPKADFALYNCKKAL